MAKITCIRNADWVIAWDAEARCHTYLRGGDVVLEGNAIGFVGSGYKGPVDTEIDGADRLVMPGLIDIHSHPGLEGCYRGIREEHGVAEMYMTGLYERAQAFWPDEEGKLASAEAAYCELLKSGVTSLCDQSDPYPGWVDLIAQSGLRGFLAPGYASARWYLDNRHQLKYRWDEADGRRRFEECLRMVEELPRHECGRLSGTSGNPLRKMTSER